MVQDAIYWTGPRATLVLREKVVDDEGNILEVVIWRVPTTSRSRSGVRYRLAFVRGGEEQPYHFVDVEQLLADFTADVRRMVGDERWPGR